MTEEGSKPKALIFWVTDAPADWFGLNAQEKSVLISLVSHLNCRRNGTEVWPSIARVAELTGHSESSVRRSLHRLHELELVKVRSDRGKSNTYTINADLIKSRADPCQSGRGQTRSYPHPCQAERGTPVSVEGDPCQPDTRTTKEQPTGNSKPDFPSFGCSSTSKVIDGDQQRKLALLGIVAETTKRMRITDQEQPTEEKKREDRKLAAGALAVKERPG